jgi:hypothetical protein
MKKVNVKKMISLKPSDLPSELKKGSLYKTLVENGDEEFEIEEKYVVKEFIVNDIISFKTTLDLARYWDLYRLPIELYIYSFLHHEEVLSYVKTLDNISYNDVKEDFLYSIGLTKYKYEVIEYVKNMFCTLDDDLKKLLKELEDTVYLTYKLSTTKYKSRYLVQIGNNNEIVDNDYTCINVTIFAGAEIGLDEYVHIYKINNNHMLSSLMKMNIFSRLSYCIKESIEFEYSDKYDLIMFYKNILSIFDASINITRFNRDHISQQFEKMVDFFYETVKSVFPIKLVADHVLLNIGHNDFRADRHVPNLLEYTLNEEDDDYDPDDIPAFDIDSLGEFVQYLHDLNS